MSFVRNIWDGTLSLAASVASVAIVGGPVWATHRAVDAGVVSGWYYVPAIALIVLGGIMAIAFLRKATGGVAPLRERRR